MGGASGTCEVTGVWKLLLSSRHRRRPLPKVTGIGTVAPGDIGDLGIWGLRAQAAHVALRARMSTVRVPWAPEVPGKGQAGSEVAPVLPDPHPETYVLGVPGLAARGELARRAM